MSDKHNVGEALTDEQKLQLVVELCADTERGVGRCIERNREIFSLIYENSPDLFEINRCSWVRGWLETQDQFLVNLSHAVGYPALPWTLLGNDPCQWYEPVVLSQSDMLDAVLASCDKKISRIFKRIDENRQLLDTLLEETPSLLRTHSQIECNIALLDVFLTDIAHALNLKQQIRISDEDYPRPWPGTIDVAGRYRKYQLQQVLLMPQRSGLSK